MISAMDLECQGRFRSHVEAVALHVMIRSEGTGTLDDSAFSSCQRDRAQSIAIDLQNVVR
jgi:hypothetical protein